MSFVVYGVENIKPLSKKSFDTLLSLAKPQKQQLILNQKIKSNADNSLIGIALAKYALMEVFGLRGEMLEIEYAKCGKPYLKNNTNIHFNISHSGNMTVCAASDSPVGIDIEKTRCFNEAVSKKIFGTETTKKIINALNTDKEFTKLWTEREAVLKLTGEGISGIRKSIDFSDYKLQTLFYKNYCITIATKK